jgi:hypothetical protein
MLSISHTLTGAFLAVTLQNPFLFIPVVLASHYLEDWFPHWDVGTGLSSGRRKRTTAIILEFVELGISFALLFLIFQVGRDEVQYLAWFGAFLGLLPDFLEAPRNFLRWEPAWLKPINDLHQAFHHSTPNILRGLAPQIVLWIFIGWMMLVR